MYFRFYHVDLLFDQTHGCNLILTIIIVVVVTILMALMHPRPERAFTVSPQLMNQLKLYESPPKPEKFQSPSDWMNWWPGFNIILFIGCLVWLYWYFSKQGLALTLDVVNLCMLALAFSSTGGPGHS
jgi:short subunit fatty acids transporter